MHDPGPVMPRTHTYNQEYYWGKFARVWVQCIMIGRLNTL
jgi:hypothetical protein